MLKIEVFVWFGGNIPGGNFLGGNLPRIFLETFSLVSDIDVEKT